MSLSRYKPVLALAILFATAYLIVGLPAPAAPPVTVDEVIPNVGEQSQSLTVRIKGKGFNNSASVHFLLKNPSNPQDPEDPEIIVGTTTVLSSREIDCDISITGDADIDFRDVEIRLSNGRKGGGTDAFRVEAAGGGGGNEIEMDVTMDDIEIDPSGPAGSGAAEVKGSFTNLSTQGGAPLAAEGSLMVWAERCGALGDLTSTEIDLDLGYEPQLNCTREDYRSATTTALANVSDEMTVIFSGLPAGDYVFFVDLNTNQSSNYAWKHGFAVGSVD